MSLLGDAPWVDMPVARVATDAPVSTDLMNDICVNENYLKSTLTDGASAQQSISTKNITANGTLTVTSTSLFGGRLTISTGGFDVTGNSDIDGNLDITGDLSVGGNFLISDLLVMIYGL